MHATRDGKRQRVGDGPYDGPDYLRWIALPDDLRRHIVLLWHQARREAMANRIRHAYFVFRCRAGVLLSDGRVDVSRVS